MFGCLLKGVLTTLRQKGKVALLHLWNGKLTYTQRFACLIAQHRHWRSLLTLLTLSPCHGAPTKMPRGCLRGFSPKGTDFAKISNEPFSLPLHLIHHRPRKCLGWNAARESFSAELSHLTDNPPLYAAILFIR